MFKHGYNNVNLQQVAYKLPEYTIELCNNKTENICRILEHIEPKNRERNPNKDDILYNIMNIVGINKCYADIVSSYLIYLTDPKFIIPHYKNVKDLTINVNNIKIGFMFNYENSKEFSDVKWIRVINFKKSGNISYICINVTNRSYYISQYNDRPDCMQKYISSAYPSDNMVSWSYIKEIIEYLF